MTDFTAFRRDMAGHPIPGGSQISAILNVSVGDSAWTMVKVPAGKTCKAFMAKLRSGSSWKLKKYGEGPYLTVTDTLSVDIALRGYDNLFQAQTSSGDDILEVMLLD